MKRTIWQKFEEFPPIVCRLLARQVVDACAVRALSNAEIAKSSGMTELEVQSLSHLTSWDDVPVGKMRRFMSACNVDLNSRSNLRLHVAYIRSTASWKYLKRSPEWTTFFQPLMKAYVRSQSSTA